MMEMDYDILACLRIADGSAHEPSDIAVCEDCKRKVWRARSAPQRARILCIQCLVREIGIDEAENLVREGRKRLN